jgi:5'-nucleotidase
VNRSALRRLSAVAITALFSGLVLGPLTATTASAADPTLIDVLTFNDFHGRIEAAAPSAGAAVLAGLAKQQRAANPNTLVVSAGDNVGASTFTSFVADDQPTIDALNGVGVDVSTLGNHEFDQGRSDVDNRLLKGFNFPFVSANLIDKTTGTYAYDPYVIKTVAGVRVAFVGAITQDLPGLVSPAGITTLAVTDIASSVDTVADQLKDGNPANGEADVVIMLVHEGAPDATQASVLGSTAFGSIVQKTAGHVDAIVSGHTHQAYSYSYTTATGQVVPVIQAAKYGEMYGHLAISADSTTHKLISISSEVKPLVGAAAPDPAVAAVVTAAVNSSAALGARSLGSITSDITRAVQADGATENRGGESTLTNLLADVDEWALKDLGAEVGLQNPGGTRADLLYASSGASDPAGNVTYKEAANVQPFANTLVTLNLTGAQLKQVLEEQWQPAGLSRPFLKLGVSKGFEYTYDPAAATGSHITAMYLSGAKVTDAQVVKIGTNAFLAAGGDQFFTLAKGTNVADSGRIDLQSFVAYMAATSPVSPDYAQRAVGVTVAPPANGSAYATGETVTVTVSSMLFTKAAPASGDASLAIGGQTLATTPLSFAITNAYDEQGQATLTFAVPKGLYGAQTATIAGPGGTSIPLALTMQAEPAATTLTGSASPWLSLFGTGISYSAHVTSAGATLATGTVTVYDRGRALATGTLVDGKVKVALPRLSWGIHYLSATYSGDGSHKASTTKDSSVVLVLL